MIFGILTCLRLAIRAVLFSASEQIGKNLAKTGESSRFRIAGIKSAKTSPALEASPSPASSSPVVTKAIVCSPFVGIAQDIIGFLNLLESFL